MSKAKVIRLTIRIPEELKQQLEKKAELERRSLNSQVIKVLEDGSKKAA